MGGHKVWSAHDERKRLLLSQVRDDGSHGYLDLLCRNLSHLDVVLLAQVVLDVAGEHVSCGSDAVLLHEASEGDHCNFSGASAYVDHHISLRGLDVQTNTQGGCHRLEDQIYVPASGVLGGVTHCPDFHFRGAGRDAHDNFEVGAEEAAVLAADLLDEASDHHFGCVEVGNHAITQRPDGLYAGIDFLVHQLGLLAQGNALAGIVVYCDDARLVQHYLSVLVYDGVGCSEVNCKFLIQE